MLQKEHLSMLDLDSRHEKVLKSLSGESLSISEIQRRTRISRMTIYNLLSDLKSRGLVSTSKKGKRHLWHVENKENVMSIFLNLAESLQGDRVEKTYVTNSVSGVVVRKGLNELVAIYDQMIKSVHRYKRIYGIQPIESVKEIYNKLPISFGEKYNKEIIKNKIIVEAALQENFFSDIARLVLKKGGNPKKYLETFLGRMADVTLFPNELVTSPSELIMFNDIAYIFNWKDEVVIEIKNDYIMNLMTEFFSIIKTLGKKIDFNQHIKEAISRLNL